MWILGLGRFSKFNRLDLSRVFWIDWDGVNDIHSTGHLGLERQCYSDHVGGHTEKDVGTKHTSTFVVSQAEVDVKINIKVDVKVVTVDTTVAQHKVVVLTVI